MPSVLHRYGRRPRMRAMTADAVILLFGMATSLSGMTTARHSGEGKPGRLARAPRFVPPPRGNASPLDAILPIRPSEAGPADQAGAPDGRFGRRDKIPGYAIQ